MTRIRLALSLLAVALLTRPADAQLVTNGDFESGNLLGWTLTPNTGCFTGVILGAGVAGNYGLRTGPTAGTCALSQSFSTTAGQQYTFSFWLENLSDTGPNSFEAQWNGVSVYSVTGAPQLAFTQKSFTTTATSSTTTISFVALNVPSFWTLDNVAVTAVATVPEPSTYALMAIGLTAVFVVRRRRRA